MVGRLGSVGVRQVPFAQFLWWDLVQWARHIAAAENPRVGSHRWSVAAKKQRFRWEIHVTAVMMKSGATSLERACDLFKHLWPCNWRGWTWSWQKLRWRLPEQAVCFWYRSSHSSFSSSNQSFIQVYFQLKLSLISAPAGLISYIT